MFSTLKAIFKELTTKKLEVTYSVIDEKTIRVVTPIYSNGKLPLVSMHDATFSFGATPPTITTTVYGVGKNGEKQYGSTTSLDMLENSQEKWANISLAHSILKREGGNVKPLEEYMPFLKKSRDPSPDAKLPPKP